MATSLGRIVLILACSLHLPSFVYAASKLNAFHTLGSPERQVEAAPVKYLTTPMGGTGGEGRAKFLRSTDRLTGVPYMNEIERLQYRTTFVDGLAYRSGKLLGKTSFCCGTDEPKEYIYVMDAQGFFYIATRKEVLHHSSFLASEPVAAAGLIRILNGQVSFVSNESGHYHPSVEFLRQAQEELNSQKVNGFEVKEFNWD